MFLFGEYFSKLSTVRWPYFCKVDLRITCSGSVRAPKKRKEKATSPPAITAGVFLYAIVGAIILTADITFLAGLCSTYNVVLLDTVSHLAFAYMILSIWVRCPHLFSCLFHLPSFAPLSSIFPENFLLLLVCKHSHYNENLLICFYSMTDLKTCKRMFERMRATRQTCSAWMMHFFPNLRQLTFGIKQKISGKLGKTSIIFEDPVKQLSQELAFVHCGIFASRKKKIWRKRGQQKAKMKKERKKARSEKKQTRRVWLLGITSVI